MTDPLTPERIAELRALKLQWEGFNRQARGNLQEARACNEYNLALRNAAPALLDAAEDGLKWRAEGWQDLDVIKDTLAKARARIAELEAQAHVAALDYDNEYARNQE